jgi:serine/threonine-protein kinase
MRHALLAAPVLALLLVGRPARSDEVTKQQCVEANDAAQDLRQGGRLRQAREQLVLCASASCPALVRADCAQRLSELDAASASIVFEATDDAGRDLSAVQVTMDGQPFLDRLDGTSKPVDLGPHQFVFTSPGLAPANKTIVVREGDKARRERIVLMATVATGATATTTRAETVPEPSPAEAAPDGRTQRLAGLAVGGAGVVGVLVGSIFGLVSKSTYDHAFGSECGSNAGGCSAQGVQDGQTAHDQATIATVGFVAGLALLGGGAALYFTAPHQGLSIGPTAGPGGAGVRLGAAW